MDGKERDCIASLGEVIFSEIKFLLLTPVAGILNSCISSTRESRFSFGDDSHEVDGVFLIESFGVSAAT